LRKDGFERIQRCKGQDEVAGVENTGTKEDDHGDAGGGRTMVRKMVVSDLRVTVVVVRCEA